MRKIVKDMLKCGELCHVFNNQLCVDDQKTPDEYSDQDIIDEAKYQLSLYYESGTTNNEMFTGEWSAEEQAQAKREVQQIKRFLAKYA